MKLTMMNRSMVLIIVLVLCSSTAAHEALGSCKYRPYEEHIECPLETINGFKCTCRRGSKGYLRGEVYVHRISSWILTLITNEESRLHSLLEAPKRFAKILDELLGKESVDNTDIIEFENYNINAVFGIQEVTKLDQGGREFPPLLSIQTQLSTPILTPEQIQSLNQLSYIEVIKRTNRPNILIIIILLVMSAWTIATMIGRFRVYRVARIESREFAPRVAQLLKNDHIEEAIIMCAQYRNSHLATIVNASFQEIFMLEKISDISDEEIKAGQRAMRLAIAFLLVEFKRGLIGLKAIGSTAPMVGLLGMMLGCIQGLQMARSNADANAVDVIAMILNGLLILACSFALGVLAKWCSNNLTQKIKNNTIEMDNTASEVISYIHAARSRRL